ncbi:hypothetical protein [Xenorhabdus bovienii]|nr:hypothetical protein [Xenorhabdus bovienii]
MSPARKLTTQSRTARRFCFISPIFPLSCVACCPVFTTLCAKPSVSQRLHRQHWINHCEHCGAQQDDTELFAEVGGAFFPASREQAATIQLHRIDQPFVGYCEDISHHHDRFDPKQDYHLCNACDWFASMTLIINNQSTSRH